MNKKILTLCLFLLVCVVFQPFELLAVHADGEKIFVSADGTGTACTQSAPCLPIQGLANATDGDTIYFRAGIYTGTSNPILTVTKGVALVGGWDGAPTGNVMLDPDEYETEFDGEGERGLLKIDSPSDVYDVSISGFVLRYGFSDYGGAIDVKNGKTIIENNAIKENHSNNYGGGIHVTAQDGLVVRNNLLFDNYTNYGGGGIHINRSFEPEAAVIENNTFLANRTGASGYGGAIDVSRSAAIINANRISNTRYASSAILVTTDELVQITNNFIDWDIYDYANGDAINIWYVEGETTLVVNNTIVNAKIGIKDTSTASASITNNIFYGCWKSIDSVTGSNFTGTNNLFYNNQNDPLFLSNPVTLVNPLFVDEDKFDYHIQKDSPAVDAGAVVTLDSDFDGDPRPVGDGYDIGADEVLSDYLNYIPLITR